MYVYMFLVYVSAITIIDVSNQATANGVGSFQDGFVKLLY
jgi:hypothetical protein